MVGWLMNLRQSILGLTHNVGISTGVGFQLGHTDRRIAERAERLVGHSLAVGYNSPAKGGRHPRRCICATNTRALRTENARTREHGEQV
jgi:hypothetical protein